jgi:predicted Abi (CAAX) family protease
MNKEKYAEWWATPPKLVGPLVVALLVVVVVLCMVFVATGKYQEAILTCAAGAFLLLTALLDLAAEVIRHQKLILDELERANAPKS